MNKKNSETEKRNSVKKNRLNGKIFRKHMAELYDKGK